MVANEKWFGGGDANFYNGVATQSLRVESGDAGGLSRTVGSSITNRKKFTISAWVKPTHVTGLTSSGSARMFAGYGASGQYGQIGFYEDQFYFYEYNNASYLRTTQLFRDRAAWYNIQVIVDTTESTAGDRNKVYVNGSRVTDFSTQTNYSLNYDSNWNIADSSTSHRVGTSGDTGGNLYQPFSGYISDFHFIDGSAVASTNFGELKNGVWIPKKYSGSYGYGGYHLEFKQTGTSADASGIGADTSGNNLHFTVTNYVASDSNIPDSPENNFATINSLFKKSNMTYSEGNLKYTTSTNQRGVMGNFSIPIGTGQKYYFEYIHTSWASSAGDDAFVGLNIDTVDVTTNRGGNNTAYSYGANSGAKVIAGTESSYGSSGWTTNDVIGIAVDRENNTINFAKNNTYQGTFAIPSTGNLFAWAGSGGGSSSASGTFNFGQDSSFVGVLTAQNNSD